MTDGMADKKKFSLSRKRALSPAPEERRESTAKEHTHSREEVSVRASAKSEKPLSFSAPFTKSSHDGSGPVLVLDEVSPRHEPVHLEQDSHVGLPMSALTAHEIDAMADMASARAQQPPLLTPVQQRRKTQALLSLKLLWNQSLSV